mmetsp:Transcript_33514/g.56803  ORF Transcript_33514/g.56803 Transcript_33514/m.56803 type:complete len:512 (-) Transcript_33514:377-1912(-)
MASYCDEDFPIDMSSHFSNLEDLQHLERPHSIASNHYFSDEDESMSMFQLGGMHLAGDNQHWQADRTSQPCSQIGQLPSNDKERGCAVDFFPMLPTSGDRVFRSISMCTAEPIGPLKGLRGNRPLPRSDSALTAVLEDTEDETAKLPAAPKLSAIKKELKFAAKRSIHIAGPGILSPRPLIDAKQDPGLGEESSAAAPPQFTKALPCNTSSKLLAPRAVRPCSSPPCFEIVSEDRMQQQQQQQQPQPPCQDSKPTSNINSNNNDDDNDNSNEKKKKKRNARLSPAKSQLPGRRKAGGKRPTTKNTRGLKYLSNKVCEALSGVGTAITQDKMISLLYQSFISENNSGQEMCEKSIRRRIYDTINVLMALGLVEKTKQHIEWIGKSRPKLTDTERRQAEEMKQHISEARTRTRQKRKLLEDEELQYVRTKTLLDRNEGIRRHKRSKRRRGEKEEPEPIHLPFLVVRTSKLANVECVRTPDLQRCSLNVSKDVDIYNDYDILCLMAGGAASSHS